MLEIPTVEFVWMDVGCGLAEGRQFACERETIVERQGPRQTMVFCECVAYKQTAPRSGGPLDGCAIRGGCWGGVCVCGCVCARGVLGGGAHHRDELREEFVVRGDELGDDEAAVLAYSCSGDSP